MKKIPGLIIITFLVTSCSSTPLFVPPIGTIQYSFYTATRYETAIIELVGLTNTLDVNLPELEIRANCKQPGYQYLFTLLKTTTTLKAGETKNVTLIYYDEWSYFVDGSVNCTFTASSKGRKVEIAGSGEASALGPIRYDSATNNQYETAIVEIIGLENDLDENLPNLEIKAECKESKYTSLKVFLKATTSLNVGEVKI